MAPCCSPSAADSPLASNPKGPHGRRPCRRSSSFCRHRRTFTSCVCFRLAAASSSSGWAPKAPHSHISIFLLCRRSEPVCGRRPPADPLVGVRVQRRGSAAAPRAGGALRSALPHLCLRAAATPHLASATARGPPPHAAVAARLRPAATAPKLHPTGDGTPRRPAPTCPQPRAPAPPVRPSCRAEPHSLYPCHGRTGLRSTHRRPCFAPLHTIGGGRERGEEEDQGLRTHLLSFPCSCNRAPTHRSSPQPSTRSSTAARLRGVLATAPAPVFALFSVCGGSWESEELYRMEFAKRIER